MFAKACEENELRKGKYEVAAVNQHAGLDRMAAGWPAARLPGNVSAFQRAPGRRALARFNGKVLTCTHHDWEFDGESGACVKGKPCSLAEYPLKIENGEVLVDTADVTPCRV